ncbi:Carboxylic ester hydrolase [Mycena chlorophos]|uniref:Carboxylic ester hydrolase n=1 Tax=Mycena chlorophos TaxID=658473 RepID=A0A8H6VRX6_MYCCL|nr:Carboxylic ester hydrolase [Mycena chlorophos]
MLFRFVGFAAAFVARASAQAPLSTVTLDYGTFTGLTNESIGLISFLGIRYADPPIGDLRWRAPVSPPSTNLGHVNATALGFACIGTTQTNSGATTNEDCGGFETGRTRDAPAEYFMPTIKEPMLFVTFEYRLGQFGFLAGTPVKENGTLNAGLWDQRAGLEWVQRYISLFGGDPTRVTIWGQSAGAASIMYHLIAEGGKDRGLFHQAMADSPPALYLPEVTDTYSENLFTQFATLAGCDSGNSSEIMTCLRAASTKKIATAGSDVLNNLTSALYPIAPILDGTFLTERPIAAFESGRFIKVPGVFGYAASLPPISSSNEDSSNTNEGSKWSNELTNPLANTSEPNATQTTVYNFLQGQYPTLTRLSFDTAVELFYPLFGYGNYSLQGQQMYGEMRYICSALLMGSAMRLYGKNAWQYHWDNPFLGSNHGSELDAFFEDTSTYDDASLAVIASMREYWNSFVVSGVPTSSSSNIASANGRTVAWTESGIVGSPRILLHPAKMAMEEVDLGLEARCAYWHLLENELGT